MIEMIYICYIIPHQLFLSFRMLLFLHAMKVIDHYETATSTSNELRPYFQVITTRFVYRFQAVNQNNTIECFKQQVIAGRICPPHYYFYGQGIT